MLPVIASTMLHERGFPSHIIEAQLAMPSATLSRPHMPGGVSSRAPPDDATMGELLRCLEGWREGDAVAPGGRGNAITPVPMKDISHDEYMDARLQDRCLPPNIERGP
jgi:hypothetical protein